MNAFDKLPEIDTEAASSSRHASWIRILFDRLIWGSMLVIAYAAKRLRRAARQDAKHEIVQDPKTSPTLAALLKLFQAKGAAARGRFAGLAKAAASDAKHIDEFELARVLEKIRALNNAMGQEPPDQPHIGTREVVAALLVSFIFEIVFNLTTFSSFQLPARLLEVLLAIVTAVLAVLAAHHVGARLRQARLHPANYLMAGLLALLLLGATAVLADLRYESLQHAATLAQEGASIKNPQQPITTIDLPSAVAMVTLALLATFALAFAAIAAFYGTPADPRLRHLHRLERAERRLRRRKIQLWIEYDACRGEALAIQEILQHNLEHLQYVYIRAFLLKRSRIEKWRRIRAWLRRFLPVVFLIGVVALARDAHAASPPGTYYELLVDPSLSIGDRAEQPEPGLSLRAEFRDWINGEIVPALRPGDRLGLAFISADEGLTFRNVLTASFAPDPGPLSISYWLEPSGQTERFDRHLLTIRAQIDHLVTTAPWTNSTCILDSLSRLAPAFAGWRGRKELVILSDGLESCGRIDFEHVAPPSSLVTALAWAGRIPRLPRVRVWIAGAWAPSPWAYQQIEAFWRAYFTRAGATLPVNHYGYTLENFHAAYIPPNTDSAQGETNHVSRQ